MSSSEAELWRLWRLAAFSVPEGGLGDWRVKRSFITAEDAAENRRQAEMFGDDRFSPTGYYTALLRGEDCWMADTPDEMRDHLECFEQCKARGGRVLILGLGLGLIAFAVASLPNVERVDVVELEADVIELCYRRPWRVGLGGDRVVVHHGDAFTFEWPDDARWSCVWGDIWQPMQEQNLPEMDRLHRIYGPRCDWFGAWGREWILDARRRRMTADPLTGVDVPAQAHYVTAEAIDSENQLGLARAYARQREELGKLLKPEAIATLDQAQRDLERRFLLGDE